MHNERRWVVSALAACLMALALGGCQTTAIGSETITNDGDLTGYRVLAGTLGDNTLGRTDIRLYVKLYESDGKIAACGVITDSNPDLRNVLSRRQHLNSLTLSGEILMGLSAFDLTRSTSGATAKCYRTEQDFSDEAVQGNLTWTRNKTTVRL